MPDPPPVTEDESAGEHNRMSARGVQIVATVTQTVLLGAAAAYLLRYLLMILNRTVLIYPFVALGTNLLAVLGAVLSLVALLALTLVLTGWLVHRRELSYASRGEKDPRSRPELWAGCVVASGVVVAGVVFTGRDTRAALNGRSPPRAAVGRTTRGGGGYTRPRRGT